MSDPDDSGTDTPATPTEVSADSPSDSLSSAIESAMERAIESENTPTDDNGKHHTIDDSDPSSGQATSSTGDSTLKADGSDTVNNGDNAADSEKSGSTSDSGHEKETDDSTLKNLPLTPPDSWPEDRRKEFKTLPDTGKTLLMSIYRDMEKGLKQSFDKLATERKTLSDNFGLDADQLKDLAGRYKTFQNDPVTTISQLAEEAGIDVFFRQENEEIPEFDSQADLVRWLQDRSRKEARQAAADEGKSIRDQRQKEDVKNRMQQEFTEAYQAHPDLPDHKEAVIKYISGFNLPVEMAYRLATYEGLAKLAQNGQGTKAELDKSRSELEKLQKLATMPPGIADGRSKTQKSNGLDMYETAYSSAEKAISSQ